MPTFVRNEKDEDKWARAKEIADGARGADGKKRVRRGSKPYWAFTNWLYQRMKNGKDVK